MDKTINYLLTGSQGFLGKILYSSLKNNSHNIFTVGRSRNNDFIQDITEPFKFPLELGQSFDVVIHAAGKAHLMPQNDIERQEFFDVNFEGTKNLCNAITHLPILPKSFIFISTVAVYGKDKGEMISETHSLNGKSAYAQSKILAEEYLTTWANENGIILSILRLPLIAGANVPGNLKFMIDGIRSGTYLGVGKSDTRKSIVWGEDIVDIFPKLEQTGGVYNLTDRFHPSFKELQECIALSLEKSKPKQIPLVLAKILAHAGDLLGKKAPINSAKLKRIIATLTFDDSKAVSTLGWNPSSVLEKLPSVLVPAVQESKEKLKPENGSGRTHLVSKNIIISGINGFVGSNLASYLINKKHEITGISRSLDKQSTLKDNLSWDDAVSLEKYSFNALIHLAGLAHDLSKTINDDEYLKVNRDLTINLFDSFLKSDIATFVYFSSVKAVTDETTEVLTETSVPNPQSIYGKSKLLAEEFLLAQVLPQDKRLIIFRPCMIHGPGNKGNLNILYNFVSKGFPYPFGAYENKRSFLSIENLCFILEKVIIDESIPSGIYNLSDDEALSTNEVVRTISKTLNKTPIILPVPKFILKGLAKIGDYTYLPLNNEMLNKLTQNYMVSNSKIKLALKIDNMPITSREGLSKTIQSFKNDLRASKKN